MKIAIRTEDGIEVHAAVELWGYVTLCCMDGSDCGQEIVGPSTKPIDCMQCHALWSAAQGFSAKDFKERA